MLAISLTLGLTVFFTIELLRKLPVIKLWTLEGKKPWGCDLCMSFWIGGMWNGLLFGFCPDSLYEGVVDMLLISPASAGVALVLIYYTDSLEPPAPPELP